MITEAFIVTNLVEMKPIRAAKLTRLNNKRH